MHAVRVCLLLVEGTGLDSISRCKCKESIAVRTWFSTINFLKSLVQIPGVETFREKFTRGSHEEARMLCGY